MKQSTDIRASSLILWVAAFVLFGILMVTTGCTMATVTDTITLNDGSKVETYGQANLGFPSIAGARNSADVRVVTDYSTSQESLDSVAVREAIRASGYLGMGALLQDSFKGSSSNSIVNNDVSSLSNSVSNSKSTVNIGR